MSDLPKANFLSVNPKYYVLAQYTRHIRPGMAILSTGELETIAAYDPRECKLVIVAHNCTDQVKPAVYDLSKFTVPNAAVSCWITEPVGGTRYQERTGARITGGRLETSLTAYSVQTFEIQNVAIP